MTTEKPRYVYMLSDYDEHGAENAQATLERAYLVTMLQNVFSEMKVNPPKWAQESDDSEVRWREQITSRSVEAMRGLAKVLAESDDFLVMRTNGRGLEDGWGGYQLHVIQLQGATA